MDNSGKRRLDNGEVVHWKLTDDPPPKKKAPPSVEEEGKIDTVHKRKKDTPQDGGAKKRVRAENISLRKGNSAVGTC